MKQVNIYDAKTNLSKLIEMVNNGEEVVIAKAGKPVASIVNYQALPTPKLGIWKDNPDVMIPDDFNDADPEILGLFEESIIFPRGNV